MSVSYPFWRGNLKKRCHTKAFKIQNDPTRSASLINLFGLGRVVHTEDVVPFIKYLLGTILAAYKDFEDRVVLVETKLPALEMVRRASKNRIGRFNKQDIRELCPTLSDSSIEGALRKLVAAGELKKEGRGKNTCYFRLN